MEFPKCRFAHRGVFNNTTIPENSLKAFRKAVLLGYGIELDVELTRDNQLVVFHDDNLFRMTGVDQYVCDALYSTIFKYPLLDTRETIPTLDKVLDVVCEKVWINIEVKSNKRYKEMIPILMNTLKDYHHYVIQSFDPRIIRMIKKNYPEVEVGYLMNQKKSIQQFFLNSNMIIRYSKADFISVHKSLIKSRKIQKLRKKMPVLVWTIQKNDTITDEDYIYICNDLI